MFWELVCLHTLPSELFGLEDDNSGCTPPPPEEKVKKELSAIIKLLPREIFTSSWPSSHIVGGQKVLRILS